MSEIVLQSGVVKFTRHLGPYSNWLTVEFRQSRTIRGFFLFRQETTFNEVFSLPKQLFPFKKSRESFHSSFIQKLIQCRDLQILFFEKINTYVEYERSQHFEFNQLDYFCSILATLRIKTQSIYPLRIQTFVQVHEGARRRKKGASIRRSLRIRFVSIFLLPMSHRKGSIYIV